MQVVAAWTGIPVERVSQNEAARLRRLPAQLSAEIVGQQGAVAAAARAVQRARVGLKDPSRPQATLLFAGPTGVGKTSLCTALAEHLGSRVRSADMCRCCVLGLVAAAYGKLVRACSDHGIHARALGCPHQRACDGFWSAVSHV